MHCKFGIYVELTWQLDTKWDGNQMVLTSNHALLIWQLREINLAVAS